MTGALALVFVACWSGGLACWLTALANREPGVGLLGANVWFRLNEHGRRCRNWGMLFWLGAMIALIALL